MGQITNVLTKDDNGADITFIPKTDGEIASWAESSSTLPAQGLKTLQLEVPATFGKNGVHKSRLTTVVPIMEVPTGGTSDGYSAKPKVAHFITIQTVVISHERATSENIADALRIHTHAMMGAAASTGAGVAITSGTADILRDSAASMIVPHSLVNRRPVI